MAAPNKKLMQYVSAQLSKDASCNLTPVFDSYRSHVGDIALKSGDKQLSQSVVPPAAATAPASTGTHSLSSVITRQRQQGMALID